MNQFVIPGHALRGEVRPYTSNHCDQEECSAYCQVDRAPSGVGGHARCECGEESPHLHRTRARRDWHRGHKRGVMAQAS